MERQQNSSQPYVATTIRKYLRDVDKQLDDRSIRYVGTLSAILSTFIHAQRRKVPEGKLLVNEFAPRIIEIALTALWQAKISRKKVIVRKKYLTENGSD